MTIVLWSLLMLDFIETQTNDFKVTAPKDSQWKDNNYVIFETFFENINLNTGENLITTETVNNGKASFTIECSTIRECTFVDDLLLMNSYGTIFKNNVFVDIMNNNNTDIKNIAWFFSNTNITTCTFSHNLQPDFQEIRIFGFRSENQITSFELDHINISSNNYGDGIGVMTSDNYVMSFRYCGFYGNALYRKEEAQDSYVKYNNYPAHIYLFNGENTVEYCNFVNNTVKVSDQSIIHSCYINKNDREDKIEFCYMNNLNNMPTKGYEIRLSVNLVSIKGTCFGPNTLDVSGVTIGKDPENADSASSQCSEPEINLPGTNICFLPTPSLSVSPSPTASPPRSYPENYECINTLRKGIISILPLKKLVSGSMSLLLISNIKII